MEIPEGWRKTSLGALVKHTKGFAFKSKNYKSSGVRIIRISDTSGLNIKVGNEIYCSEKEAKSLDSYQLEVDDIIVNTVGSRPHLRESMVGRVIRITKDEAGSLLNQNMVRLKPNSAIDSDFLFYSISNEHFLDFVSRIVRGNANQVSITLKDLFTFPASLPPLPEQKRIAKIIGTWNQAIAVTEALIDQSEAQKKALMQQLLTGKRRLPGFEGEWREVKLGNVAKTSSGGTPKSTVSEYYDGDILWASVSDMTSCGKYISSTDRTLSQLGIDNSSARVFPANTVLIAMYASIGETAIVETPMATSQAILGIQPKNDLDAIFLYYLLSSQKVRLKTLGQQGTQSNLNAGMIKSLSMSLPSVTEQEMIAKVLSVAEREITALQAKLQTLKTEKAALMQQLLTGKRRVKLTEVAA